MSWSRSAGHVDWYDVTLEDTSSGSTRNTRVMGSATPQSGFSSLLPGTLYTISVVATAGNKSAAPVHRSAATGETREQLWYVEVRGTLQVKTCVTYSRCLLSDF